MTLDVYGGLFEEDLDVLATRMDEYGAAQRGAQDGTDHAFAQVRRVRAADL